MMTSAPESAESPETPAVYLSKLLEIARGDQALAAEFAQCLVDDLKHAWQELEQGLAREDFIGAFRGAHSLKGLALTVGAANLEMASRVVERALKTGAWDRDATGLDRIKSAMDLVVATVSQAVADGSLARASA